MDGRSISQSVGILFMGMIIGSLSTILWQGMNSADDGVGAGIRQMIETSRTEDQRQAELSIEEIQQPEPQETDYDFYTVLPEMEVVVLEDQAPTHHIDGSNAPDEQSPKSLTSESGKEISHSDSATESTTELSTQPLKPNRSMYMLQAGSYRVSTEAERLRANLAIKGLVSTIQKVSIQGKGDFYRVRLGPYPNYESMVVVDEVLIRQGIKPLRLKISQNG
ncbi:MAG: hypothetical protein GKR96_07080 [Gammaproteobacteria bacterium]|nr:hypothetical protein [Gammaproteobacteria bacterium]